MILHCCQVASDPVGACFRQIDEDGNGTIEYGELHRATVLMGRTIPKHQIKPMIREVDVNGDGRLDLDEFRKMLASESAQDSPWGDTSANLCTLLLASYRCSYFGFSDDSSIEF